MGHLLTNIAEYAIILNEKNEFLLVQWGEAYNFTWHFPGGRVDDGEKDKEGLLREVQEELGVDIEILNPVFTKYFNPNFHPTDKPRYAVFYLCKLKDKEIRLNTDELHSYKWFALSEIDSLDFWLPFYNEMLKRVIPKH